MIFARLMPASKWRRWLVVALSFITLTVIACWPVETRFGVNYQWSTKQMRLYEKIADFIGRDLQTRRLVRDILTGTTSEQVRILAILDWVGEHVRPTPNGFPVIDDHVLHIIIRGYGAADQRTEVFAMLASYAGMPSTATILNGETGSAGIVVALVRIDDSIHLFDIINQVAFFKADGRLADVDRLVAEPSLIRTAARDLEIDGIPYEWFFSSLTGLRPNFSRMEMQKPWYRLTSEASKLFWAGAGR